MHLTHQLKEHTTCLYRHSAEVYDNIGKQVLPHGCRGRR